jgi:HEAT repeat protein/outer membrane protein assembly factor BamD (BamD/ComL family)
MRKNVRYRDEKMNQVRFFSFALASFFLVTGCTLTIRKEEQAFNRVIQEESIQSYQVFLTDYPKSRFRKEAENRLLDLTAFKKVQSLDTVRAYQQYLLAFPNGARTEQTFKRMLDLEFEFYKKVDTLWGYKYFIKKYPHERIPKELWEKMECIRYEQARNEDSIKAYEDFLKEFPSSKYGEEVKEALDRLKEEEKIFKEMTAQRTPEAYKTYIQQRPPSAWAKRAKERISQYTVREALSKKYHPVHKIVLFSEDPSFSPIAKLFFRNPSPFPTTFYFSGKESFFETFQPGEAGTLEFLSDRYKLAVRLESSPEIFWAGEVMISGENFAYLDLELKALGMIDITQSITRYRVTWNRKKLRFEGGSVYASPELLAAYNQEVEQLKANRNRALAMSYPLKKMLSPEHLINFKEPFSPDKVLMGSASKKIENERVNQALIETLGDVRSRSRAISALRCSKNAIWPFIALIKQSTDEKKKGSREDFIEKLGIDVPVRDTAATEVVKALIQMKQGVPEAIVESMKYCDGKTQVNLLPILEEIADPRQEEILPNTLEEGTDLFRQGAVIALMAWATEKSNWPLLEVFDGPLEEKRHALHEELLKTLKRLSEEKSFRVGPDLYNTFLPLYREWIDFSHAVSQERLDASLLFLFDRVNQAQTSLSCSFLGEYGTNRDVDSLIQCLKGENDEVKVEGLKGLARLKDEKAIDSIAALIKTTQHPVIRQVAIETLGRFETSKAIDHLIELLKTVEDKGNIIKALGRASPPEIKEILVNSVATSPIIKLDPELLRLDRVAVPHLRRLLQHPEAAVRKFSISCLATIDDKEASKALLEALKEKEHWLTPYAIESLYRHEMVYRKKDAPGVLISALQEEGMPKEKIVEFLLQKRVKQAAPILKEIFNQDKEKGRINYEAITLLSALDEKEFLKKEAVIPLLDSLRNVNPQGDYKKFRALGEIKDGRIVKILLEMLNRKDRVYGVVQTLGYLGSQEATLSLIQLLGELRRTPEALSQTNYHHPSTELMVTTIHSLGSIRDPRAVPILAEILEERPVKDEVIDAILHTLGEIGGKEADKALIKIFSKVKDIYSSVPKSLSFALFNVKSPEVVNDIIPILESRDKEAREKAVRILARIGNPRAIDLLIDYLLENPDQSSSIADAIGRIGIPALDSLLKIVDRVKGDTKVSVISALRGMKDPRVIMPMVQSIEKESKTSQAPSTLMKESLKTNLSVTFPELLIPEITLHQVREKLSQSGVRP